MTTYHDHGRDAPTLTTSNLAFRKESINQSINQPSKETNPLIQLPDSKLKFSKTRVIGRSKTVTHHVGILGARSFVAGRVVLELPP